MRTTVPLRQNGRIVIPHPVREELNLEDGDLVELDIKTITGQSRTESHSYE